jgi:hypothetical protein
MGRQLRSLRGVVFFLIGLCVVGTWIAPQIFLNRKVPTINPHATLTVAPVVVLLITVLNLFMSTGERAVSFTQAEVDFLFPGPFSRRSVLLYKLIKTGLGSIVSALIFGVILGRYGGTFLFRFAGIWLLFQFMQLLAMTVALVQSIAGERLVAAGRWWIAIILAIAAGLAVLEVFHAHHELNLTVLKEARYTLAGRTVLAPFAVFARVLVARNFLNEFLPWAAVAAGIDLSMALLVVLLDANYLEVAAAASAKRYDRISRFRRSGLSAMARPGAARWRLPVLPWAAGTGPIIWRQLTTALRTARAMLILFVVIAIGGGIGISMAAKQDGSLGFMIGMIVWLNLFLSRMMKFDFRGDLDLMDVLRSLPLRPTAVAAAQVVAPVVVLSLVQLLMLITLAIAGQFPVTYLIIAAVFVTPLNLLTIAADNLLFLLFPFRPTAAVAGDMGLVGRQTIVFACRTGVLLIVLGLSFGCGAALWFTTNHSLPAAAVAASIPIAAAIVLLVWLIGVTFGKFDPSVSTPS